MALASNTSMKLVIHGTIIVVALGFAGLLAAQEGAAEPPAERADTPSAYVEHVPAILDAPDRRLMFRRFSPATKRELGFRPVPMPPDYHGISISNFWDCQEVEIFVPGVEPQPRAERCRLALVICAIEGEECVEL